MTNILAGPRTLFSCVPCRKQQTGVREPLLDVIKQEEVKYQFSDDVILTEDSSVKAFVQEAYHLIDIHISHFKYNQNRLHKLIRAIIHQEKYFFPNGIEFPFHKLEPESIYCSIKKKLHQSSLEVLFYLFSEMKEEYESFEYNFTPFVYQQFLNWCKDNTKPDELEIIQTRSSYNYYDILLSSSLKNKVLKRPSWKEALYTLNPPFEESPLNLSIKQHDIRSRAPFEAHRFRQNSFFKTSPGSARMIEKKNKVLINEGSLINDYSTMFKLLNFSAIKSRNGTIHRPKAAEEYVLKMIILNQNNERIQIIDSRYMNYFEDDLEEFSKIHEEFIQKFISNISTESEGKFRIQSVKLRYFLMKYNFKLKEKSIEEFCKKMDGKRIQFIPIKVCANSIFGIGKGYDDSENRQNLRNALSAIKRLRILEYIEKDTDLQLLEQKLAEELKIITAEPPLCDKWQVPRAIGKTLSYTISMPLALTAAGLYTLGTGMFCTLATIASGGKFITKDTPSKKFIKRGFHVIGSGLKIMTKMHWDARGNQFLTGEKAFITDFMLTTYASLHGVTTSGGSGNNVDRAGVAHILEISLAAVLNLRLWIKKQGGEEDVNDFSLLNFHLKNEEEKKLVRRILEMNIPKNVSTCNHHAPGIKNLQGILFLIDEAYQGCPEEKKALQKLLKRKETLL